MGVSGTERFGEDVGDPSCGVTPGEGRAEPSAQWRRAGASLACAESPCRAANLPVRRWWRPCGGDGAEEERGRRGSGPAPGTRRPRSRLGRRGAAARRAAPACRRTPYPAMGVGAVAAATRTRDTQPPPAASTMITNLQTDGHNRY